MAPIRASHWSIDEVFTTSRGSKIAKLRDGEGHCVYMPGTHLKIPFVPSTFDKNESATRVNLTLECDEVTANEIRTFDAWALDYLSKNSMRLFKRHMTREQVESSYCSCLREGQRTLLKTKIDMSGHSRIRCWNNDWEPEMPPPDWRKFRVKPLLEFSHLWIMGSQFGFVIKVPDVALEAAEDEVARPPVCPFKPPEA